MSCMEGDMHVLANSQLALNLHGNSFRSYARPHEAQHGDVGGKYSECAAHPIMEAGKSLPMGSRCE
jgi:hypothetical protein